MKRRNFLIGGMLAAGGLRAEGSLEVAYAASMTSVMEGALKQGASSELGLTVQGRGQGASGLAQLIVGGSIRPDVFIAVTASPMRTVLKAGKATHAVAIAATEMVIAYDPKSRFGAKLKRGPWWQALLEPGFRFGRTDPVTDPQGRNIIYVMQLAERFYKQPELARRVLGPDINPAQIFTEASVEARLQSGELDAASAYRIQPAAFGLPYLALPPEINLGSSKYTECYQAASLNLNGKTWRPEPLVYYAAALNDAARKNEADRFVRWLKDKTAQGILRQTGYEPASGESEL